MKFMRNTIIGLVLCFCVYMGYAIYMDYEKSIASKELSKLKSEFGYEDMAIYNYGECIIKFNRFADIDSTVNYHILNSMRPETRMKLDSALKKIHDAYYLERVNRYLLGLDTGTYYTFAYNSRWGSFFYKDPEEEKALEIPVVFPIEGWLDPTSWPTTTITTQSESQDEPHQIVVYGSYDSVLIVSKSEIRLLRKRIVR
jgi:hypothetical protein